MRCDAFSVRGDFSESLTVEWPRHASEPGQPTNTQLHTVGPAPAAGSGVSLSGFIQGISL